MAPVGSYDSLAAAIQGGADSIYFGIEGLNMRAKSSNNFTLEDLKNIAKHAPGSRIFVRILVQGSETAEWPLSRKFGCHPNMAIDLLIQARDLGLVPYGISFHVGSQQKDVAAWDDALAKVKYMFDWMKTKDSHIGMGAGSDFVPCPIAFITSSQGMTGIFDDE